MSTPELLVSIVIPCRDGAATLAETLSSALTQDEDALEVIVVDDGSSDGSRALALAVAGEDGRVRVMDGPRRGVSAARNAGASAARAEVLMFLDADDHLTPQAVDRYLSFLRSHPRVVACFGRVAFMTADGQDTGRRSTVPGDPLTLGDVLGDNPACTGSNLVVRREAWARVGGFDETLSHAEDQEWLARAVCRGDGEVRGVDATTVWYRLGRGGLSADLNAMAQGWERLCARFATADPDQAVLLRHARARHRRYLARQALRSGGRRFQALAFMLDAVRSHPALATREPRRTLLTLAAALVMAVVPRGLGETLFARHGL
ncbi:glycosyltransferase family 2 protein [Roseospira visakhapatnamensis]|uniref:Glycosyltransferase involved in cell wall biosynthesis n=1 Tax=Roseospira visakhapatnamensis TaxID=390880 RepID=A0A7W6RC72_9PROT|nr:glycosyltransferase [Roseospira visakhapatnamensis]MBB4265289.1 glycosyltransferase involved in cell wall biosynthesis [Roseospira visakhapatnamensis]